MTANDESKVQWPKKSNYMKSALSDHDMDVAIMKSPLKLVESKQIDHSKAISDILEQQNPISQSKSELFQAF